MSASHAFGIDIGGTKIGLAVGDDDGVVRASHRLATDPEATPEDLLGAGLDWLTAAASRLGVTPAAVGVAAPGPLDKATGRLLEVPNMLRWQGFALRDHLQRRAGLPAAVMNDANASVLAEAYWGAAKDCATAVFLTMSTGMGAGLWLDGRLFEGPLGLAGEIGHIRLGEDGPVGFGKRGSVEGYLSGPGMVQVARAEVLTFQQQGRPTVLGDPPELTPGRILEAARAGDAAAVAVLDRCGHELGRACALLVDLLNPDVIVLGTIGTAHFDLFAPRIERVLREEALPQATAHVQLRPSGLTDRGNQAALAVARHLRAGTGS